MIPLGEQLRAKAHGRGLVRKRADQLHVEEAIEDALIRANLLLDPFLEIVWPGDLIYIEKSEHEHLTQSELDDLIEKRRAEMWERIYARARERWRSDYEDLMESGEIKL